MNINKRQTNETQEQYRKRQQQQKYAAKGWKRGRLVWDSSRKGTYVRSQHGPL